MAVVRLPALKEFYEALRTRTKLGVVAFEPRRIEALKEMLVADAKDDLEAIGAEFKKLGLEVDDLLPLAAGEVGLGVWFQPRDDGRATLTIAAWSMCGEASAEKLLAALEKGFEDRLKGDHPARRDDVELAGVNVRHFMLPNFVEARSEAKFGLGVKNGVPNGNFQIAPREGDEKKQQTLNGYSHLLVCRSGDALLALAISPEVAEGEMPEAAAVEEALQRGREAARGALVRLLEARAGGGEGPVERWLQTPGLAAALPEGVPLVEAEIHPRGLATLLTRPEAAETRKMLDALGLSEVGPFAYRMTLEGTTLRSGFFIAAPQPRQGVLALLDQPALPPQAADWVAGDVVGYQHLSMDLGKAYTHVGAIVAGQSQKAKESLAQIEAQSEQFLQISPAALLSSLGTKHVVLSFLPEAAKKPADGEDATPPQNAMAFVWRVSDEALWRRLMGTAALVTGQPAKEEQGFSGLRHETPEFSGGWFLGDGNMVLAFGKGVTERTLAMLRNPPRGPESLAGGPLAHCAAELVAPQPGITYEITNGPSTLRFINDAILESLSNPDDESMKKLKEVWPTADELEGLIGVSAGVTLVDGNGLTHTSVSDLPAP
ncbi:MAG: hypothetical protein QM775_29075 [Pirellulales bacterium]